MNVLSMDEKTTSMDHDGPYVIKDDMPALITERIHRVMDFFPELLDQSIVFCWKPNVGSYAGQYEFKKRQVNIAPAGDSIYTIAHELTHAVQFIFRTLPYGERSCDIWTMARSHELIDKLPFYVRVPKEIKTDGWQHLLHSLANEAIDNRANGLKNYISWFESELRRQAGVV